jgi:hypothetical protein
VPVQSGRLAVSRPSAGQLPIFHRPRRCEAILAAARARAGNPVAASSIGLVTAVLASRISVGYRSILAARSAQLFAAAARYIHQDLMVGVNQFERAVRAGLRFAVHRRRRVQYVRRDFHVPDHASRHCRCRLQLHASQQCEWHQRCCTLSADFARADVLPLHTHDVIRIGGVSACAGQDVGCCGQHGDEHD